MNLFGTLAKVAMGVMVARGVGKMISSRSGGGASGGSPQRQGGSVGSRPGSGGLGGLLGGLMGGGAQQQGGGLGGLLGGALSGKGTQSGGLGGILDGLSGGQTQQRSSSQQSQAGGDIGAMLNQAFGGEKLAEPKPEQNAQAEILLRGMLNAAKSDGKFDDNEQAKILEHLGDVTQEEIDFVRAEMAKPLDVDGFVRSVPRGLEQQVYVMSLLGIELDSQAEAKYLDRLAKGLGISPEMANAIHEKVGVPSLYG